MLNKILTFILLTCFIIVNCQEENVSNETNSLENLDIEGSGLTDVDLEPQVGNETITQTSAELKADAQNAVNGLMKFVADMPIKENDGSDDDNSIDDNSSTLKLTSSWMKFLRTGVIVD